jgi:hypothetical protein
MAKQTRTSNPTARSGRLEVEEAHSQLDRVARVARTSVRVARATANLAQAGEYRWQAAAQGSRPLQIHFETGLRRERTGGDGFWGDRGAGATPVRSERDDRRKIARAETGWGRAMLMEAGARWQRQVLDLSRAVKALSRAARSSELRSAGRAISDGRKYAMQQLRWDREPTGPARAGFERERRSFEMAGLPAKVHFAPIIRGVNPPANVSRREFARPTGGSRVLKDGNRGGGITVNSSPTVVINSPAGGAVQHDLIGALRAHREELFDQLKREFARRERTQF